MKVKKRANNEKDDPKIWSKDEREIAVEKLANRI